MRPVLPGSDQHGGCGYAPVAMIADAVAIARAEGNIIGGRLKIVDAKTTAARGIAVILVADLGPGPAVPAAMVAAR